MVCLSFSEYRLKGFKRGSHPYKYTAILINKETGRERLISFGHQDYQQYKDSTGLGLYTHKNHGDKDRRERYRERHKGDNLDCFSAGYFSMRYLW